MKDISSFFRILNSLFAVQNGEFIDRFSNSRWSRALNRSFSRNLSACRSIMRPRFLCTTTQADQAMAAGRFELYRVYSTIYTSDSKQCWRNRPEYTDIGISLFSHCDYIQLNMTREYERSNSFSFSKKQIRGGKEILRRWIKDH